MTAIDRGDIVATFAATLHQELLRALLSSVMTGVGDRDERVITVSDISRGHLHSIVKQVIAVETLVEDEEMFSWILLAGEVSNELTPMRSERFSRRESWRSCRSCDFVLWFQRQTS